MANSLLANSFCVMCASAACEHAVRYRNNVLTGRGCAIQPYTRPKAQEITVPEAILSAYQMLGNKFMPCDNVEKPKNKLLLLRRK